MSSRSGNWKTKEAEMAKKGNYQDAFADGQRAKKFRQDFRAPKSNDPQWYFKDTNILDAVASFSFNTPLGTPLNIKKVVQVDQSAGSTTVPGLMTLELLLSPGISTDAQSPLNLAAQNVYSFVRYKNSGRANYDAPDLMMYLLAMDSIYSAWNWMKRLYGFARTYDQMNRYKPKSWIEANHVDFDDMMSNLADFRAFLNMAAERITSFCVPAAFKFMVRHSWIYSNVYLDSQTRKAQCYMYVPYAFYQYDETSSPTGSVLQCKRIADYYTNGKLKVKDLERMINDMINNMQYSEDVGIMSGDIMKAYGENTLFRLSTFDADYTVDAVYNMEVLMQFENAMFFPFENPGWDRSDLTIRHDPNTNFIKYQPEVDTGGVFLYGFEGWYTNFHKDNPTPEDLVVASRINFFHHMKNPLATEPYVAIIDDCGSEICVSAYIWYMAESENAADIATFKAPSLYSLRLRTAGFYSDQLTTEQAIFDLALMITNVVAFDWAPQVLLFSRSVAANTKAMIPIRDWDNYNFVSKDNYFAVNQMALLSLFNVPQ